MIRGNLFEKALLRVNFYLKVIGLGIDRQDSNRSFIGRIRNRWFCMFNIFWFSIACTIQFIWLINGVVYGTSTMIENTYSLPCLTLCCLGFVKSYFIIKYAHYVNELVQCLTYLQLTAEITVLKETLTKKWTSFLNISNKILVFINTSGLITFTTGPLIKTALSYYHSGEIVLNVPFLGWYPFDVNNISYWPFAYIHQLWAGIITVNTVFGPDSLYYTSCTFIHIQFSYLQYDLKSMIERKANRRINISNEIFHRDLVELVNRHRQLMRCINLLEVIYSKSTLFNVLSSSLVICVCGFNVMAIDDLAMMIGFIFFLGLGLFQIYLFCYYGNTVMQSIFNRSNFTKQTSRCFVRITKIIVLIAYDIICALQKPIMCVEVSDAVYDSNWYEHNSSEMKDYLFIMMRAQSPCKLTACGFSDINLRSFGRILSTAWSYFALLVTMYDNK